MKNILRTPSLKRVGVLMGGTVLGQVSLFAATPVLSRIYTAEAFSNFGIYLALSAVFAVISTLRLEGAIPVADTDGDALSLTRASLLICSLVSVFGSLSTLLMIEYNIITISIPSIIMALLVGVSTFLIGTFQIFSSLGIRHDRFSHIARAKAGQGLTLALSQVILGSLFPGAISFILGDVLGRLSGILSISRDFLYDPRRREKYSLIQIIKKYRAFPIFSAPASLINTLGVQAPVFILGAFISPTALGLFVFANRLIVVPTGLIAQSMAQVFLGEIGKAKIQNRNMQPIFIRYALASLFIASMLVLPVLPLVKYIVPFVFGSKWIDSIKILNTLLLLSTVQITSVTVSQTLNTIDKNSWQLVWDICRFFVVSGTIIISLQYTSNINSIIIYFAVASAIMYAVLIAMGLIGLKSYISINKGYSAITES